MGKLEFLWLLELCREISLYQKGFHLFISRDNDMKLLLVFLKGIFLSSCNLSFELLSFVIIQFLCPTSIPYILLTSMFVFC